MRLPFVDQTRLGVVKTLQDEFSQVKSAGEPRLVVIEGHPGTGKTRIIQEFYERLRTAGNSTTSWPELLRSENYSQIRDRGRIGPGADPFHRAAAEQPGYNWFPIRCHQDPNTGLPARALVDAAILIKALHEPVASSIGSKRRVTLLLIQLAVGLVGAALAILGSTDPLIVGVGAGIALIALATLVRQVAPPLAKEFHRGWLRFRNSKVEVLPLATTEGLSGDSRVDLEATIRGLCSVEHPGVLVLDDAGWADDDTLLLLDNLMRTRIALLIVASRRPALTRETDERPRGIDTLCDGYCSTGLARRISLEALSGGALATAIKKVAPRTDESVVNSLVAHANGNPLVLTAMLEQPIIERNIHDGALRLDDLSIIDALPRDPQGVFDSYWDDLPNDVKQLLAVATIHGLVLFSESVATTCAATLGGSPATAISRARDPYYWLASIDEYVDRFSDPMLFDASRRNVSVTVSAAELMAARRHMILDLVMRRTKHEWTDLDPRARKILLQVHVTGASEELVSRDLEAAKSALELGVLMSHPFEAKQSISILRSAIAWAGTDEELRESASFTLAKRLRALGWPQEAAAILRSHLEYCEGSASLPTQCAMETRLELARALVECGHPSDAISSIREILSAEPSTVKLSKLEMSRMRSVLGDALIETEQYGEALREYLAALNGLKAELPRNAPELLQALNHVAYAMCCNGRMDAGIHRFESLISAQRMELGPFHPDTIRSQQALATALVLSPGFEDEGLGLLVDAVTELGRHLGPVHRDTMRARWNYAWALRMTGDSAGALDLLEKLLEDQERYLEADHPDTTRTRVELARARSSKRG